MTVTMPESGAPHPFRLKNADTALRRILIVDDEDTIRHALSRYLRLRQYDVDTAESGNAAMERLALSRYAVLVSDVRMPGMSGLEVLRRVRELDEDIGVVMLSAVNDAPTATEALAGGALDYLTKPIDLGDFQKAIEAALRKRELLMAQRHVERQIRDEVAFRTEELEKEKLALRNLTVAVAEALVNAMEAKDLYLLGHSHRVAELAASMASELNLDEDAIEAVRLAGRIHDIGKIGIREAVLHKPGKLDAEEFEHVKEHVRIGMDILAPLKHIDRTLQFVQDHHEHVDGTGYPRGLAGDAISIGGQILCAADAYDALTSKRPYRDPMTPLETVAYLKGTVGTLLSPRVYNALQSVVTRRKSLVFLEHTAP